MRNPIDMLRTRRALNALATGNYAESRRFWEKIRKRKPDAQGIRHNIALTYIGEQQYEQAEALLLAEIEDFGAFYPRVKALADMYYVWGQWEKAHERYCEALECSDVEENQRKLVKRRIEQTNDSAGYGSVLESLQLLEKGNTLLEAEQWEDALEAFRKAAALDPTNLQALNNIGTIQLNYERDPNAAANTFRRALSWSHLPWLSRNLKQAEKAKADRSG